MVFVFNILLPGSEPSLLFWLIGAGLVLTSLELRRQARRAARR